ncbi:MAG: PH domain-containing protein [Phycisphaerales bacterium]
MSDPTRTAPLRLARARWPGERVIVDAGPSAWFIVLGRPWWMIAGAAALVCRALTWVEWGGGTGVEPGAALARAASWCAWGALACLTWAALDWACRRYTLTDRRIVRASGVLRRVIIEAPLKNIQSVTLLKSIRERVVGIGTLGVTTAGSAGLEFTWFMIARPHQRLDEVRAAVRDAQGAGDEPEKEPRAV